MLLLSVGFTPSKRSSKFPPRVKVCTSPSKLGRFFQRCCSFCPEKYITEIVESDRAQFRLQYEMYNCVKNEPVAHVCMAFFINRWLTTLIVCENAMTKRRHWRRPNSTINFVRMSFYQSILFFRLWINQVAKDDGNGSSSRYILCTNQLSVLLWSWVPNFAERSSTEKNGRVPNHSAATWNKLCSLKFN